MTEARAWTDENVRKLKATGSSSDARRRVLEACGEEWRTESAICSGCGVSSYYLSHALLTLLRYGVLEHRQGRFAGRPTLEWRLAEGGLTRARQFGIV